jgi:hypothetical protein
VTEERLMAGKDWNQDIISEFRANEGSVGGPFEGMPLLLLHHRGAKTGKERVNPLAYQDLGGGAMAVFGSEGEERELIWEKQKRDVPGFAGYERNTERQIPVVILERDAELPDDVTD